VPVGTSTTKEPSMATQKAPAKKAVATKTPAKSAPTKKTPAKKAAAKAAPGKKAKKPAGISAPVEIRDDDGGRGGADVIR
jgi:hypothetical protein